MARDARAPALARLAAALAGGAGIELPPTLALWWQAGGRLGGVAPRTELDPARVLVDALAEVLTTGERRRGAHYTPAALAADIAERALPSGTAPGPVVDPTCGGGSLLLAAGDRLVALGVDRAVAARDLLWGADIDPLAVAVTEVALVLWSGGVAPARGHLVTGDALIGDRRLWTGSPPTGFAAVVGNPPFQGQLARDTVRARPKQAALQRRFGPVVTPYVDTAALFLLAALDLVGPAGRVVMVQPQSSAAARDAGPVREAIGRRARVVDLVVPPEQPFAAHVDVCLAVLEATPADGPSAWSSILAADRGVPVVSLPDGPVLASRAQAVAGFRQHYYGLVGHVSESSVDESDDGRHPLITCGTIEVGRSTWGARPTRFARRSWSRPVVDVAAVSDAQPAVGAWIRRVQRPKVLVASQTRVVEAVVDRDGRWVPGVPVVAVVPDRELDLERVAAVLCAPPVSAWVAAQALGSGLSAGSVRMSASLTLRVPLPPDGTTWDQAAADLAAGDLDAFATSATAMYGLPAPTAAKVIDWWHAARPALV